MRRSPFTTRAERGDLPAASLDDRRPDTIASARTWTVADLKSWTAREAAALDRNDDNADANARALRSLGVIR